MKAGMHAHSTKYCNTPAAHSSALSCPLSIAHVHWCWQLTCCSLTAGKQSKSPGRFIYETLQLQTSPCQSLEGTYLDQAFITKEAGAMPTACLWFAGPSSGCLNAAGLPDLVQAPTPMRLGPWLTLCCSGLNGCHLPAAGQFDLGQAPTTKESGAIADALFAEFVSEEVDKVELVYTKFVSLISSDPIIQTLLPLTPQVGDLSQVVQPKKDQLMNSFSFVGSSSRLPQERSRSAPIIQSLLEPTRKVGHAFGSSSLPFCT